METFFIILRIGIIVAGYICPTIGLYWYANSFLKGIDIDETVKKTLKKKSNDWTDLLLFFVYGISFFSLTFFLSSAFESALWFLPESWGKYDVDIDEFETTREIYGRSLAMGASIVIYCFMSGALWARIDQVRTFGSRIFRRI